MYRDLSTENKEETLDLNYTLDQMNLTDIYRTFYPIAAEYTVFSWDGLQDRSYVRPQNKSWINFRRLKSYRASFSNHNSVRLKSVIRRNVENLWNVVIKQCYWTTNVSKKKLKGKIEKYLEQKVEIWHIKT